MNAETRSERQLGSCGIRNELRKKKRNRMQEKTGERPKSKRTLSRERKKICGSIRSERKGTPIPARCCCCCCSYCYCCFCYCNFSIIVGTPGARAHGRHGARRPASPHRGRGSRPGGVGVAATGARRVGRGGANKKRTNRSRTTICCALLVACQATAGGAFACAPRRAVLS